MVSVVNEAVESQAFSMRAVATVGGHLPLSEQWGVCVTLWMAVIAVLINNFLCSL